MGKTVLERLAPTLWDRPKEYLKGCRRWWGRSATHKITLLALLTVGMGLCFVNRSRGRKGARGVYGNYSVQILFDSYGFPLYAFTIDTPQWSKVGVPVSEKAVPQSIRDQLAEDWGFGPNVRYTVAPTSSGE